MRQLDSLDTTDSHSALTQAVKRMGRMQRKSITHQYNILGCVLIVNNKKKLLLLEVVIVIEFYPMDQR